MVKMIKTSKRGLNASFEDAILTNSQTYIDYLERMKKIALSMFEWVNLPEISLSRTLLILQRSGSSTL